MVEVNDRRLEQKQRLKFLGRFGIAFLIIGALVVGFLRWTRWTPSSPPAGTYRPVAQSNLVAGIPAPEGAELGWAVEAGVILRIPAEPGAVLDFYRSKLGKFWGPYKPIPNGLQFDHPKAPVLYVTVSRMGNITQASFIRNALVPLPKPTGKQIFFGVSVPPNMHVTMETPTSVALHVPGPPQDHAAWFRTQFTGKPRVTIHVDTEVAPTTYYLATTEDKALPYATVVMRKSDDSQKPGPGDFTEISIDK